MASMSPLAFSVIASIVLTVLLNVALHLFPGSARRLQDRVVRMAERLPDDSRAEASRSNVRVVVPWKAMLIVSVVLTVAINVALIVFR